MFGRVFLICCLSLLIPGREAAAREISLEEAQPWVEPLMEERAAAGGGLAKREGARAIPFPWEPPTADNIDDICAYVGQRRIEPPGPPTAIGFSQRRLQAQALLTMEASFGRCCRGDHRWTGLACAMDGWIWSLQQYCQKEINGKSFLHKCCKMQWKRRYDCFTREAHARSYASAAATSPDPDSPPDRTIQLLHEFI